MRVTVDLPDDLHRTVTAVARERCRSLSAVVTDLIRRGLDGDPPSGVRTGEATSLPIIRTGLPLTTEDVRALDDDQ